MNECVDLHAAYRNTNCSAKCPGHGVTHAQPHTRACTHAQTDTYTHIHTPTHTLNTCPQVCNHRSECQCEPGWVPPHCSAVDQSVDGLSNGKTRKDFE